MKKPENYISTGRAYEEALVNLDQDKAREILSKVTKIRREVGDDMEAIGKAIGYPRTNIFFGGNLNSHFKRIMTHFMPIYVLCQPSGSRIL